MIKNNEMGGSPDMKKGLNDRDPMEKRTAPGDDRLFN